VSRRNGHLIRTSLGTKKLEEARRAISRTLADRVVVSMTAREPQAVPLPEGLSLTPVPATAPVPPTQAAIVTPAVTPPPTRTRFELGRHQKVGLEMLLPTSSKKERLQQRPVPELRNPPSQSQPTPSIASPDSNGYLIIARYTVTFLKRVPSDTH